MEKRESENDLSAIQFDRERLEAENKELKAAIEKLLSKSESVAEYKARLKELIKERIDKHENNFYDNVNDSHAFGKLSECRYLLELFDKL